MADLKELDKFYSPCGPCAFCGFHDKRHRLWDAWIGMLNAGDTPEDLADEYEADIEHVKAVQRLRPYQED